MTAIRRVMILGGPGAGKSTLAGKLGQVTGIPVTYLDQLFWRPGWVSVSDAQMTAAAHEAARAERWIIDGNYSSTWPYRVSRADLIVFLDLPRGTRLRRILWRILTGFGRVRPGMADGCPERFDRAVWDDACNFDRDVRPELRALIAQCRDRGTPRCVILRSPAAVEWFVAAYPGRFGTGRAPVPGRLRA